AGRAMGCRPQLGRRPPADALLPGWNAAARTARIMATSNERAAMSTATIVCAVNETTGAAEALHAAGRLCERLDVRLVAVHVVEDVPVGPAARREARAGGDAPGRSGVGRAGPPARRAPRRDRRPGGAHRPDRRRGTSRAGRGRLEAERPSCPAAASQPARDRAAADHARPG